MRKSGDDVNNDLKKEENRGRGAGAFHSLDDGQDVVAAKMEKGPRRSKGKDPGLSLGFIHKLFIPMSLFPHLCKGD